MRKKIVIILGLILVLTISQAGVSAVTGRQVYVDAHGHRICDENFVDRDGDGVCDNYKKNRRAKQSRCTKQKRCIKQKKCIRKKKCTKRKRCTVRKNGNSCRRSYRYNR